MASLKLLHPAATRRSALVAVAAVFGLAAATTAVSVGLETSAHLRATASAATPTALVPPVVIVNGGKPTRPVVTHSPKVSKHLVPATILVSSRTTLSRHEVRALRQISGVRRTQTVSAGHANVDGHHAYVVGVSPTTFRPWTPKLTAASNPLWASIGRGEITTSFDMGNNAKLPLGTTVPVKSPTGRTPVRIGAFASIGLAGVDAVVDSARAHQLGLTHRSGVLISAPKADPLTVRAAVQSIIGKHAHAELLNEVVVTRDAGEFLTRAQISGFLKAAASRLGAPYVWGATGPNSFDCSGLVQWAFAQIGITMPRVAQDQFFTGPHIPLSDALPGDLIFYHYEPQDPTFVSHVAIYVGNDEMLEAPHTGENVKIVPVPLPDMAGVVRVDPALASQIS
jgi:peptidoglycan DL-endopeptidase CwlO